MGINRVTLLGRLGADPELRYTPSQQPVCNLRVATTERRKSPEGEWTEYTEWHRVTVWGKMGENCAQYLAKGREVYVEGRLQTRKWQDQEGKDRYSTDIVAQVVEFIGGGRGESAGGIEKVSTAAKGSSSQQSSSAALASSALGETVSLDDDEIPF